MLTQMAVAFEDAEQKEGDIPATAPSTQAPDGKSDAIIRTRRYKRIRSDQAVDAGDPANPPSRADLEEQLAALIEFQYVVSQKIAEITARLHGD